MDDLGKGNFTLEFFVQALPCYIFLATFVIRNKQIRDLGSPRASKFGGLLTLKLTLSIAIIIIRIL